jgi:hypothetical protein
VPGNFPKEVPMKKSYPNVTELLKAKEERRRELARLPPVEKFAIAKKMREFGERLRNARKRPDGRHQRTRETGGSR